MPRARPSPANRWAPYSGRLTLRHYIDGRTGADGGRQSAPPSATTLRADAYGYAGSVVAWFEVGRGRSGVWFLAIRYSLFASR